MSSEHSKVVVNVIQTGSYVIEHANNFLKDYNLTVQQFNILRILRGQKGSPINLCELQGRMIHKMSNTTRLVEKLRIKGMLERKVCEINRRKVEILITEKGLELLARIDQPLIDFEKKIVEQLTKKEMITLLELLERIKN